MMEKIIDMLGLCVCLCSFQKVYYMWRHIRVNHFFLVVKLDNN